MLLPPAPLSHTTLLAQSRSTESRNLFDVKQQLKTDAMALGFDAFGVTAPDAIPLAASRLRTFLDAGRNGDMEWMVTNADRRADPRVLWPDVRSVIMLGASYAPPESPLDALARTSNAAISVYAKGRDYHDVLKSRLKQLAGDFALATGSEVKVFVDTAPLMEKPLAAAAGLGWQGKHTNLVSRDHGSWLFLGAIMTTASLAPDAAEIDHCGSCRRCLDVCPTNAFPAPYQLDARRCIAYLTIEYRGHIASEFRAPIGNRVFGCDDCLAVCPWNKFAQSANEAKFAASPTTDNPPLAELLTLDDATFRTRYAGTPIKRTGRNRVVRNALIAAGNSGNVEHLPAVISLLDDASPLVRAMAVWALHQLADTTEVSGHRSTHSSRESDLDVLAEWQLATPTDTRS
jgi:epoxyqueuosine reductase